MKIIVRGTNWIGDTVMTVPALTELRRAFPDAHITLHARPAAAEVLQDADFIDEIIPIGGRSKAGSIFSQTRQIREGGFDIGITFTNSPESAAVQWLARVPMRFGYATQRRAKFLTDAIGVPEWKNDRHEVYYYLNLIEAVKAKILGAEAVPVTDPELVLNVSVEKLADAADTLSELGIDRSHPLVALGIGSTNSRAKRWPADRYAALADRLASETKAQILLVGSNGDKDVAAEVQRLATSKFVDLCGQTGVAEAMAILGQADLLISNDMGLAHLAPAVGTPTIVIFGPTNDVTTRPFSQNAEIIRRLVDCAPCMLRDCPIDHRCMTGVSVDEVFERARARIESK